MLFLKHSKLPAMQFEGLNVCDVNGSALLHPSDLGAGIFVALFMCVWESGGGAGWFLINGLYTLLEMP